MKESILKQKTYAFALKVINVYKQIVTEHKEYVLSKQFLKSGTAPGALVREAFDSEKWITKSKKWRCQVNQSINKAIRYERKYPETKNVCFCPQGY